MSLFRSVALLNGSPYLVLVIYCVLVTSVFLLFFVLCFFDCFGFLSRTVVMFLSLFFHSLTYFFLLHYIMLYSITGNTILAVLYIVTHNLNFSVYGRTQECCWQSHE